MPRAKSCPPCLTPEFKARLLEDLADQALRREVQSLPECGRKRSAYQSFVSECMKAKNLRGLDPEAMRDCARQWRERRT